MGIRSSKMVKGLIQLREKHNDLIASYHALSTDNIVALDLVPPDTPKGLQCTLKDIIMGICDPFDASQGLFTEVWMGALGQKTHFVVLADQEATAAE
jgi:hypothetical protein